MQRSTAAALAALAAAFAAATADAKLKYTVSDYVTDGLVAWYDGIHNVAADAPHDASATKWADLSGNGNDMEMKDYTGSGKSTTNASGWTDAGNGYMFNAVKYGVIPELAASANLTVEVFGDFAWETFPNDYPNIISRVAQTDMEDAGIFVNKNTKILQWKLDGGNKTPGFSSRPQVSYTSWDKQGFSVVASDTNCAFYVSGEMSGEKAARKAAHGDFAATSWNVGCNRSASNYPSAGTNNAIRIYNRALTAEEVKANWLLDQYRFRTGIPVTNAVIATEHGAAELSGAFAVDGSHVFTASSVEENGATYAPVGYTLENWDEDGETWLSDGEATHVGAEATVTEGQCVRITWVWATAPTISSASVVGGDGALSVSYALADVAATAVAVVDEDGNEIGAAEEIPVLGETGTIALSLFSGTKTLCLKAYANGATATASLGAVYGGAFTLSATDAQEGTLTPAVVTITRVLAGDNDPALTVNFALGADGDTAAAGTDYAAPSTMSAAFAAGAATATVSISPIFNAAKNYDTSFTFAIADGNYPSSDASLEVAIVNAATRMTVLAADDFSGYANSSITAQAVTEGTVGFSSENAWVHNVTSNPWNPMSVSATALSLPAWMKGTPSAKSVGFNNNYSNQHADTRKIDDGTVPDTDGRTIYFRFVGRSAAAYTLDSGQVVMAGLRNASSAGQTTEAKIKAGAVYAGFVASDIAVIVNGNKTVILEGYEAGTDYMIAVKVELSEAGAEAVYAYAETVADFPTPDQIEWIEATGADIASSEASLEYFSIYARTSDTGYRIGEFALAEVLSAIMPEKEGPKIAAASVAAAADGLTASVTFGKTGADTTTVYADYTGAAASPASAASLGGGDAAETVTGDLSFTGTAALRVTAANGDGDLTKSLGTWYNGAPTLAKVNDAKEDGLVAATLTVSRGSENVALPLVVNYTIGAEGDTAVAGTHYVDSSGSVTIAAGETTAAITVAPLMAAKDDESRTFTVALAPGNYWTPSAGVEVTVENLSVPADMNYWVAAPDSDHLASTDANWSRGVPAAGSEVWFGQYSVEDCVWDADAPHTLSFMTLQDAYTGVVSVQTTYPEYDDAFTCLTLTGMLNLYGGTLSPYTHGASTNRMYRLRVDVEGGVTIGSLGAIDATGLGRCSSHNGFGHSAPHGGSTGGVAGSSSYWAGAAIAAFDSVFEPVEAGWGAQDGTGGTVGDGWRSARGGGAVYVTAGGEFSNNGAVKADGQRTTEAGAAGGAIYVSAASFSGGGSYSANASRNLNDGGTKVAGAGGRIALVASGNNAAANLTAYGEYRGNYAGAGTIYLKGANTNAVFVANGGANVASNAQTTPIPAAGEDADADWDAMTDMTLEGGAHAHLQMTRNAKFGALVLDATATLDLNGTALKVAAATANGEKVKNGVYAAGDFDWLADAASGGSLAVGDSGFRIIIR